ncbi:family 16 glycoside hydrolase [Pontibacter diazotrophicus]|uniref:family 16 glycoside hydrolase n=1 Tax=Pontibacter diazotrophicus TaxID=1400979 RepID=UPI001FEB05EE|nr:family 16 glycoside hydrolase [Pontibacter diazotrophicus]
MMRSILLAIVSLLLLIPTDLYSQVVKLNKDRLEPVNVSMSIQKLMNKEVVRVVKDTAVKEFDEPTFVRIKGIDFQDGTIEVKVLSRLLKDAPDFARGFIGIAFRINDNNTKYESIYVRPTNSRSEDQVRRNHSIQYYAYPDYKFDRLRKEAPERYESYADMGLNEWIKIRIEVKGQQAKLFVNGQEHPSLIVNDLKHGANTSGAIGLWVDVGTEGFFTDLKVRNE